MHGFHLIRHAHSYTVSTHSRSLIIRNYPIAMQNPKILICNKHLRKHTDLTGHTSVRQTTYFLYTFIVLLGRTRQKPHTVSKPVHSDDSLQTQQRCRLHFSRKQQFIPQDAGAFRGGRGMQSPEE